MRTIASTLLAWGALVLSSAPLALLAGTIALLAPGIAGAQGITASQATGLDPSIQTAAMGGASVAVFWLDEPNEWGNPAGLGTVRGVRYVHGESDLAPLAPELNEVRSDRLLLGAWGIGVSIAGKPFENLGGLRLEYAPQTSSDGLGGSIVTRPYEEVRSFSVGVSALDLLSNLGSIGLRDRIFLSGGHTWKDVVVETGVDTVTSQPRIGEGSSADWGALVRVVPFDGIGASVQAPRDAMAAKLELAAGYTERNYREPEADDLVRILERETIRGVSGRLITALPTRIDRGWFWDFAAPTISFAFAWERTKGDTQDANGTRYDLVRSGGEVTALDMFSFRMGRVDDDAGFEGNTYGAGVTLQYRKAIGVKFDWARVPWTTDSDELDRFAITAFIEPLRFDASGGLK